MSDLEKPCPWSKGQPIGNGIYCAPWHSASSYPIPPLGEWDLVFVWFHLPYYYYYYPIPPEGEWDLVFVWFHLRYYYYTRSSSSSSSSKGWSDFTLLLKLSQ